MKKLTILWQIIVFYASIACIVYFISNYALFVPPPSTYSDEKNIKKITTRDGKRISAIYLQNPEAEFTIIYSHGNAEDIGVIWPKMQVIHDKGFSVLAYDYHGYGTSEGSPSEKATYSDIDSVYLYLVNEHQVEPNKIILQGFSLGAGPAIDLASRKQVGGLILEAPFVSAFRVVTRVPLFPVDKYNNIKKIDKIDRPILFIHGTKDRVIPLWHGQKLYDIYDGPKEHYWVEGAGHNNLMNVAGDDYWIHIKKFFEKHF